MVHGLNELALAGAEAIGELNVARADHVAAPALDAIEEPEILESVELTMLRGEKELLRLQGRGHTSTQFPQRMHGSASKLWRTSSRRPQ